LHVYSIKGVNGVYQSAAKGVAAVELVESVMLKSVCNGTAIGSVFVPVIILEGRMLAGELYSCSVLGSG